MALFGIAFALERVAGALASIADLLIEDRS